jgi:choice-of-anchor C domain-containing protein
VYYTPRGLSGFLNGHEDRTMLSWCPEGKRLAVAGEDEAVAVWDVETKTELALLRGHLIHKDIHDEVCAVASSPDGKRVASTGTDGTFLLWVRPRGRSFSPCAASRVRSGRASTRRASAERWPGVPMAGSWRSLAAAGTSLSGTPRRKKKSQSVKRLTQASDADFEKPSAEKQGEYPDRGRFGSKRANPLTRRIPMQRRLMWAGVFLSIAIGVVIATHALADDLPSDAAKRIKQFEAEAEAIRKKANDEINARHDKLIADLEQLKKEYTKAGELDSALAIRERLQQIQASADKARNLLVNGSFEEGSEIPKVDAYNQLENGSTALTGWVVSQGNINVIGSAFWKAADGKYSLDLNGSMPGAISQTFKTKKGQKYRVRFTLAGNTRPGPTAPTEKKLQVSAAGKKTEFTFDTTGKTPNDMGWVNKTWEFTAEADETPLEFLSLTEGGDGPALDDVVVVAIRQ